MAEVLLRSHVTLLKTEPYCLHPAENSATITAFPCLYFTFNYWFKNICTYKYDHCTLLKKLILSIYLL